MVDEEERTSSSKVEFKKMKKKPIRVRIKEDSDGDDDQEEKPFREKLEDLKFIQKLRKRPNGVNAIGLALGQPVSEVELIQSDPYNIKTGGLVNMKSLNKAKVVQDEYDSGIGTQFNAETNKRDEDEEMVKYIEEELQKRKKKDTGMEEENSKNPIYCLPEEAALQAVPDYLRQSSSHKSEEMLSNQMLSGIPEVDLGIEAKIKNIEATEEAKLKLLWERHKKKDGPSQFVPTNMAVNFVQHNRFNIDDSSMNKNVKPAGVLKVPTTTSKDSKRKNLDEKATDDFHYERFKKQFRRF